MFNFATLWTHRCHSRLLRHRHQPFVVTVAYCHPSSRPKRPSNLKGRSSNAQKWLERQFRDPYVIKSKLSNYRARSAFKLIQIDDRYRILRAGSRVVDCGAAPGAWTQVIVERINARGEEKDLPVGRIVAVDKIHMMPVDGAVVLHSRDFTLAETQRAICSYFASNSLHGGNLVDVVLNDMAPSVTGQSELDHERVVQLCYEAFVFATINLVKGGFFLTKLFDGLLRPKLVSDMEKHFAIVSAVKPDASRDDSAELYLLGRNFKGLKQSS